MLSFKAFVMGGINIFQIEKLMSDAPISRMSKWIGDRLFWFLYGYEDTNSEWIILIIPS